jgi:hypothetical protein
MNPWDLQRPPPDRELGRWQFTLGRMFFATTAVAVLCSMAKLCDWFHTDAVAYMAILLVAAVLSPPVQRVVWGTFTVFAVAMGICVAYTFANIFCLLLNLAGIRISTEQLAGWWLGAGVLAFFVAVLRRYYIASGWCLMGSLALLELFVSACYFYSNGCPTLFHLFTAEHRPKLGSYYVSECLLGQLCFAGFWMAGILLGMVWARLRKSSDRGKWLL